MRQRLRDAACGDLFGLSRIGAMTAGSPSRAVGICRGSYACVGRAGYQPPVAGIILRLCSTTDAPVFAHAGILTPRISTTGAGPSARCVRIPGGGGGSRAATSRVVSGLRRSRRARPS